LDGKKKGATVSGKKKEDLNTRLYKACRWNNLAEARRLLDAGADPNIQDGDGWTPLQHACSRGYTDIVRLLIDHGADVNARDRDSWTPLRRACYRDRPDLARLLLGHGADPCARDNDNASALDHSCRYGYLECVAALITAGADVNGDAVVHDVTGSPSTPLEIAVRNSDPDNVEAREQIIDWYREHHPELVMEVYCSRGRRP